jgi:hypothetical protein
MFALGDESAPGLEFGRDLLFLGQPAVEGLEETFVVGGDAGADCGR